jgi:hypothetical protein
VAIDIKALDRAIAKLQELRRLASDPEVAPFLGNGVPVSQKNESAEYDSALGSAVINACGELTHDFTVNDVLKKMEEHQYKFRATEPRKSVANMLRALTRDGHVKVKQVGKGRRETIFFRN